MPCLQILCANGTDIVNMDISLFEELLELGVSDCPLEMLYCSENSKLQRLYANRTPLSVFTAKNLQRLELLSMNETRLAIDFSEFQNLIQLYLEGSVATTLEFKKVSKVEVLNICRTKYE